MLRRFSFLICALTAASAATKPAADAEPPVARVRGSALQPPRTDALAGPSARIAAHPLPFLYDLYTFRGRDGGTAVVASFAVAAGDLQQERNGREVRHRFDVSLVLADTARRRVFRSDDSVFVTLPHALAGRHLLFTHVEVQAPPSSSTVQRVIMTDATTPGIGQLYSTEFTIPDYSGGQLMLSDIALAQPGSNAGWSRGDFTLALLPTGQFPGSAFDVYYEVYNLPAGHPYSTEITVERVDRSGSPVEDERPVRVRYAGESSAAADGLLQELRHVDTSVGQGRYRITVAITDDGTGRSVSRSRLFRVRPWAPGATLVPAHRRIGRELWARDR